MATKLIFRTQPDGAVTAVAFTQQAVVWAVDDAGAVDTAFTGSVTLAKTYGPGTLTSSGSLSATAVAGVATFAGCKITGTGKHILTASATGPTSVRSGMMTVVAAAQAAKTVFVTGANTTDKIDCGSGATLDDLTASDMTWIGRIKRTGTGANQFVCAKYGAGGWYIQIATDYGEGTFLASTKCATTDAFAYSNASNLLTQDTWFDVAAVWTVSSKTWKLYRATTGSALAEVSGYGALTAVGVGTVTSDAAAVLQIGNLPSVPTNPFKGHSEWHGVWNSALTVAQMLTIQLGMDRNNVAMMTAVTGCKGLWQTNTTGSVTDQSGNANTGTVTGSSTTTGETVLADLVAGGSPDGTNATDYIQYTSHAWHPFTTDATSVTIGWNRVLSGYDAENAIALEVGGAYESQALAAAVGKGYTVRSISAGSGKSIKLINGVHSRVGAAGTGTDGIGTQIVSLRFNGATTEVIPATPARHIAVVNDSILDGFILDPVGSNGPIDLLRAYAASTHQVTTIGYGGQTLYKLALDATARTNTTAAIAALGPTVLVIALGVNDYSNNLWTAAAFGTAYEDLLAKLITEMPTLRIKAVTPATLPSGETANGGGSTLGDYRTQIATAASGKPNVLVVNGPTELWDGANPNADNTHPSNTSAPGIASNLKWIAEIDLPFPLRQHARRVAQMQALLTA